MTGSYNIDKKRDLAHDPWNMKRAFEGGIMCKQYAVGREFDYEVNRCFPSIDWHQAVSGTGMRFIRAKRNIEAIRK